ncbi:transducin family protein / WD-40 repeat family protein isoform X3 [Tasmannia lanceolata]|uniref:transducin family protein / WD-40 repeat family protein isoform X3 n=1 Tax=Tasmannia lanceolata TaxID=3420 RepID=UPI00406313FB
MFPKRLLQKVIHQHNGQHGHMLDMDLHIALHYGIPSTGSVLAFDPIQRLLAIGTLDGRIKVIGGDNIEGLLISSKQLPYKSLEFLHNQGYLVSISNENDIQVWNLELRHEAHCLQWESNITAFAVIQGSSFMYVGDEHGLMSVLKFDIEEVKLLRLPYRIPANDVTEAAGVSLPDHQSIVGILPQPCTSGNRVLIAYENGLIILWDVSEARVALVRGYTDLQLKDDSPTGALNEPLGPSSNYEQEEKEICSLCWASTCGSLLAVGYIDGDILLWNISSCFSTKGQQGGLPSNNVVKLQLSSGDRKLPVIVLHWSARSRLQNDRGGQLFIYGGDEIGSEEVLTVLSLEWPNGIETLKCIARVDLTLNGSFADMILIPHVGATENNSTDVLFVLTSPGQLHVYDGAKLSKLTNEQEEKPSILPDQFPVTIPTVDPCMTAAKLTLLPIGGSSADLLSQIASAIKTAAKPTLFAGTKWPLTGGVPSEFSPGEDDRVKRMYIAGYQDGSVRIWDATYPVLSLMFVMEGEQVPGIKMSGENASVSTLDFSSVTMSLAVGDERGLVRVYKFQASSDEINFHFVSETGREVHILRHQKGFCCIAAFSVLDSPIRTLEFANSGDKLAVGFECGQVAILDLVSLSVLFHTDCASGSSSPVISLAMKVFTHIGSLIHSPKQQGPKSPEDLAGGVLFVLTRNAHIVVIDSVIGNMISSRPVHPKKESTAISMYVIGNISVSGARSEEYAQHLSQDNDILTEANQTNSPRQSKPEEVALQCPSETKYSDDRLSDMLLLLCCEDALRLYSVKSLLQGDNNVIHKVNLGKPCCWSTMFKRKDENASGLILLYQTGVIEIRSLPDLEVVGESSLMSILRWSFKINMAKTMSSSDSGLIALVNGCELAFISLLAGENDFRIPDSLPCLHDKVLAAAADAAIFSSYRTKKQSASPGILGGIIKGFKGGKVGNTTDRSEILPKSSIIQQLDSIFSTVPFLDTPTVITDDQDVGDLEIDDIQIDEVPPVASTSSQIGKHGRRDEKSEREKLFHGATSDMKPRLRTAEEIRAQYRKAGDVSAVAANARDKLAQRQEKLERISRRTEELQSGAENFESMAKELVKAMEDRKWWKL